MAGALPKSPSEFTKIPGAKVAIIASMWHKEIIETMVQSAKKHLMAIGLQEKDIKITWAPGSHEIPYYAKMLLDHQNNLDGIMAFGVILRGGTTHNDSVLQAAVNGFINLSLEYGKPIINEVIGVNNIEDAEKRAEDKGTEATFAFSEAIAFKRSLLLL